VTQKVLLVLVIMISVLLAAGAQAAPEPKGPRVALVMGVSAYEHTPFLVNPVHDATDIAAALGRLGYQVQLVTDARKADMEAALSRFDTLVGGADQAVIFFSGHGIEVGGVNFLLPKEARINSETSVPLEAVALPTVMRIASRARHLGLVVLDACRDNPLANTMARENGAKGASRGLAAVEPTGNLLVAYATRDGHVAADGTGRNSPYTAAFLQALQEQGVEVRLLFGRVHDRVLSATNRSQEPFIYGALGGEALYLNPPVLSAPPEPGYDPRAVEFSIWRSAQSLGTADAYRDYLRQYPDGQFSTQAKLQIAELTRQGRGPVGPPTQATGEAAPREQPPAALNTFRDCADCPELVKIPAGHFLMGNPQEPGASNERPQHRVEVPAFALGKYDVTFDQWDACVAAHGCSTNPGDQGWGRGRRPVMNVSWDDAQEYLRWLSRKAGHTYRLPSESEWEFAARAGTTTVYYWGDDLGKGHCAGCDGASDGKQTAPVGSFAPNAFGLFDMAGNVWQYTQDCYRDSYTGAPADGRAWEGGDCSAGRSVRGGSWNNDAWGLRLAVRYGLYIKSTNLVGFRVARSLQ
jgi:formylglycine-generating enzyme required for sulfatase activity